MTRKHYEAVAKILFDFQRRIETDLDETDFDIEEFLFLLGSGEIVRDLAVHFADLFEADNPKFDRSRFLDATDTEGKD